EPTANRLYRLISTALAQPGFLPLWQNLELRTPVRPQGGRRELSGSAANPAGPDSSRQDPPCGPFQRNRLGHHEMVAVGERTRPATHGDHPERLLPAVPPL